jgi:hypothetical protein
MQHEQVTNETTLRHVASKAELVIQCFEYRLPRHTVLGLEHVEPITGSV